MQYKVVCCQDCWVQDALEKLEKEVKNLCKEGWKPQGGISIAVKDYDWCYVCQAMVK